MGRSTPVHTCRDLSVDEQLNVKASYSSSTCSSVSRRRALAACLLFLTTKETPLLPLPLPAHPVSPPPLLPPPLPVHPLSPLPLAPSRPPKIIPLLIPVALGLLLALHATEVEPDAATEGRLLEGPLLPSPWNLLRGCRQARGGWGEAAVDESYNVSFWVVFLLGGHETVRS